MTRREPSPSRGARPPHTTADAAVATSDALQDAPAQQADAPGYLRALVAQLGEGIYAVDREGRVILMNAAAERLLGWRQAEVVGHSAHDTFHSRRPDGTPLPLAECALLAVLHSGEPMLARDDLFVRADGTTLPVACVSTPLRIDGALVGAVITFHDITQRQRLESAHAWLEHRTQATVTALLAMAEALVSGATDEATHAGAAAEIARRMADLTRTVFGCERVSIVPNGPDDYVLPTAGLSGPISDEERHQWQARWPNPRRLADLLPPDALARLRRGELVTADHLDPTFDRWPNPQAWRSMLLVPMSLGITLAGILTLDYGPTPYTCTPDDLALAAGVARLAALVLQREQLLSEREEARARALALADANRRMDEFLSVATHELRTPVTSSSLAIEMAHATLNALETRQRTAARGLPRTPGDDVARDLIAIHRLVSRADARLERLTRLVDDLLDVSRIRAGKLELRLAPCDLAALVRDAVDEQRQLAPHRVIVLRPRAGPPLSVVADADRIAQVVTNYLTNALKYSRESCSVAVTIRADGGWARVSVCDHGPGLPAHERRHIWDHLHRAEGIEVLDGSHTGLGLGLFLSKTFVEQHQGRIGVRSAPGKGSTFWFALPLAESPLERSPV